MVYGVIVDLQYIRTPLYIKIRLRKCMDGRPQFVAPDCSNPRGNEPASGGVSGVEEILINSDLREVRHRGGRLQHGKSTTSFNVRARQISRAVDVQADPDLDA